MKLSSLLTVGALAVSMTSTAFAVDAATNTTATTDSTSTSFSGAQTKDIQKIVHDYLVNNPEVLIEASQALQQKQQSAMQEQAQSAIQQHATQLFTDNLTVVGNPKGNVTLVEFFDYQCIHCKKLSPVISNLIKKNPNLRVIYREFPIFGKSSEMASRAALAAAMQGKYAAMHEALFNQNARLNDKVIETAAQAAGLDMNKFKLDMNSKTVTDALEANRQLGEKLHLMGTPAIIIGATPNGEFKQGSQPTFIPGAASEETLTEIITKANS